LRSEFVPFTVCHPARPFRQHLLAWAAVSVLLSPLHAAPLSFDAAMALTAQNTPVLKASQARLNAARLATGPAGELPDPKLAVGIENLPVGGPDRYALTRDFMTMQRIALMQEVPNRDKREARAAAAQARVQRAQAEHRVTVLNARRETALAWLRRYTVERQLALFDALTAENRLLATTLQAQLAAGRASAAEALMPRQEAAMLAERRDDLNAQRDQAMAALRRWVGDAGGEPLAGEPPAWPLRHENLAQRVQAHPELAVLDGSGQVLDAEVREALAMKQPDWGVELAYQRRGRQFGDMVSVQFTFDLPVFAGQRQDPQIAAKQAERLALEADREATRREHAQMLDANWAELERLDRALARNQDTLQPLARNRIALSLAAYRGGKGTLAEHVAARRESLETQLKFVALQGERWATAARLHFANDDESTGAVK
jgi:outer membrane protein, heavy metal efflux system